MAKKSIKEQCQGNLFVPFGAEEKAEALEAMLLPLYNQEPTK
jgi:hypothetical protein